MIFGIFKTEKGKNQPEFVGQVTDPDIKKVSEIAVATHQRRTSRINGEL